MKNAFKVLGIAALAAVIGFSLSTCSSSSNGTGGDTYDAIIFSLPNGDFDTIFGAGNRPASVGDMKIIPGTLAQLTPKVVDGIDIARLNNDVLQEGDDLSYAEVEGTLQGLVDARYVSSTQKTQMLNVLNSQGYGVAAINLGNMNGDGKNYIGIIAAAKE